MLRMIEASRQEFHSDKSLVPPYDLAVVFTAKIPQNQREPFR
jgi:hypothetical protein